MKLFCQTFSKTAPAPLEKPLHLRSRSRSCFWKSRSPAKRALKAWVIMLKLPQLHSSFRSNIHSASLYMLCTVMDLSQEASHLQQPAVANSARRRLLYQEAIRSHLPWPIVIKVVRMSNLLRQRRPLVRWRRLPASIHLIRQLAVEFSTADVQKKWE